MDPSSAQEMSSQTLESMLGCTKPQQEKKPRPADQQALKCPRCESTNTKFCYYNNYSLSQPRYFCKSCRRYWTKGGTLRNVPVGGGCRKNKRSSLSPSASSRSRSQHQSLCSSPTPLPSLAVLPYEASDLSLALARLQKQTTLGVEEHEMGGMMCNPNNTPYDILGNHHAFLETPTNTSFHNHSLYYGSINAGGHHVENGDMGVPYEEHLGGGAAGAAAVKQEICGGREQGENNRVLWSFPWQQAGGDQGNNNMADQIDSSRQNWYGYGYGFGSSSWHGLLNSPLM